MKLQKENENKEEEFESIAHALGIDVDLEALKIVTKHSPAGRRQVVRRISPNMARGFALNLDVMKQNSESNDPNSQSDMMLAAPGKH